VVWEPPRPHLPSLPQGGGAPLMQLVRGAKGTGKDFLAGVWEADRSSAAKEL
jgi:hypothetical protein